MTGVVLRGVCITIGVVLALLFIAVGSLMVDPGSTMASLLFDRQLPDVQVFPYPLTIQNLMHLVFFGAIGDLIYRFVDGRRHHAALSRSNLPTDGTTLLMPSDLKPINDQAAQETAFLGRLVQSCVLNFQANKSVSGCHEVLSSMVDLEMNRLEARYTLVRYVAWLLPTVGFIGTVTGISLALREAGSEAMDMSVITSQLAIAFFTTLVALVQSSVVVLGLNLVQGGEESSITDCAEHVLQNLINRLYAPS